MSTQDPLLVFNILPTIPESPEELLRQGKFPCIRCGACCLLADNVPLLSQAGYTTGVTQVDRRFKKACSLLVRGPNDLSSDGAILPTYHCSIYPERPPICRVDSSFHLRPNQIQWHYENLLRCRDLIIQCSLGPSVHKRIEEVISLVGAKLERTSEPE